MLKTVATFSFPYEAQIAKARLEAEGIPAFVADEHTINMYWLYSNALGGVKVQVPESEILKAKRILEQDYSDEQESKEETESSKCKKCGSSKFGYYVHGKKIAYLMFLLTSFPLWPIKREVKCENCGANNET